MNRTAQEESLENIRLQIINQRDNLTELAFSDSTSPEIFRTECYFKSEALSEILCLFEDTTQRLD